MDPEAMNWPVGSKRAANTSPECPVSSITGDCSELARGPCCWSAYSYILQTWVRVEMATTYSLYEGAILSRAVCDRDRRAGNVGVRLCAFNQLG